MRPRVLLDIDGVVADFLGPFLARINHHMGTDHKQEDMTRWNCYDSFDVPREIRDIVDEEVHQPGYAQRLPPLPDAIEGVMRLQEVAEVFVVTTPWSSAPTWEYDRKRWIKHWLGIGKDRVISTPAKYVCAGDALIDDKDENLEMWQTCNPHGLAIRWSGPTNKFLPRVGHTTDSWAEVIRLITTGSSHGRTWRTHEHP